MTRYVALLRGINVQGRRVKMDRLRTIFTDQGFASVSTFLASGNVLFTTDIADRDQIERSIERALASVLDFRVSAFLRTPDELDGVLQLEVPGQVEGGTRVVMFLRAEPGATARARIAALESERDRFLCHGREIHWLMAGTYAESPLSAAFDAAVGGAERTLRSVSALERLAARLRAE